MNILEIGCGDGGNLLPFTELGCNTTGVDLSAGRIKDAILFFEERQIKGNFIASDIFKLKGLEHKFDLIICHDVIEHRHYKIFCVNGKYGIQVEFRIFYFIALQNEEDYERKESSSA